MLASFFANAFQAWDITIPSGDETSGKIVKSGWVIRYVFDEDEKGRYLEYYASHRMTEDRHIRLRENGAHERLPTLRSFRITSEDPDEDARLLKEYLEHNQKVKEMLKPRGGNGLRFFKTYRS